MIDSKNLQNNNGNHSDQNSRKHSQTFQIAQINLPLPPPEMLANYEQTQPGLINKIIQMTEAESDHRRNLENKKIQAEIKNLQRGDILISMAQIFAFVICMTLIIGGCLTAIHGAQVAGTLIGVSGIVGIIKAYIENSKREK